MNRTQRTRIDGMDRYIHNLKKQHMKISLDSHLNLRRRSHSHRICCLRAKKKLFVDLPLTVIPEIMSSCSFYFSKQQSRPRAPSVPHRRRALPSKLPSDEKERSENDLLDKFSAPIQNELTNLSTSISIQSADHKMQLDALKTIAVDVNAVNESLKLLHNQNDEMKSHFNKCHESISKEANAASSAVKSLQSRFDEMESHVSNFTSEISTLLKKEQIHKKARKSRHASVERSRESNSAYLASHRKRKEYFSPSKDSVCIPKQKNFVFCNQPDSQRGKAADDEDGGDDFGLQRTLRRIEEARAKRRRSKYLTDAL